MITPTTRGFRQTLRQEDIEFAMPLKKHNRQSDQGYETLDSVTTASEVSVRLNIQLLITNVQKVI